MGLVGCGGERAEERHRGRGVVVEGQVQVIGGLVGGVGHEEGIGAGRGDEEDIDVPGIGMGEAGEGGGDLAEDAGETGDV